MGGRKRSRGSVRKLPSGRYQVRVAAGLDPLSGKRMELVEVARTAAEAEKVRTKLLSQLDERRNARTKATMSELLDRYMDVLDVSPKTHQTPCCPSVPTHGQVGAQQARRPRLVLVRLVDRGERTSDAGASSDLDRWIEWPRVPCDIQVRDTKHDTQAVLEREVGLSPERAARRIA